jgi:hypothetical protein
LVSLIVLVKCVNEIACLTTQMISVAQGKKFLPEV